MVSACSYVQSGSTGEIAPGGHDPRLTKVAGTLTCWHCEKLCCIRSGVGVQVQTVPFTEMREAVCAPSRLCRGQLSCWTCDWHKNLFWYRIFIPLFGAITCQTLFRILSVACPAWLGTDRIHPDRWTCVEQHYWYPLPFCRTASELFM